MAAAACVDVVTTDQDASRCRAEYGRQHGQQRGFTGPVRSEEPEHPVSGVKGDSMERQLAAPIADRDLACVDGGLGVRHLSR